MTALSLAPDTDKSVGAAFAPAKINLALHVTGRRSDGYHRLDSLVVFADVGDMIEAFSTGRDATLEIFGPFAAGLDAGPDNLVLRAAAAAAATGLRFRIAKQLPVASGIGGGSADAAATLRLLARLGHGDAARPAIAERLGADVPMCVRSRPLRAEGIGQALTDWNGLPDLPLLLVNPGVAVSTPAVFAALATRENPPIPAALPVLADLATAANFLGSLRNDLQAPAIGIAPAIGEALDALARTPGCRLARMSGSGATCFGLYDSRDAADAAAVQIRAARPGWWVRPTLAAGAAVA